MRTLTTAELRQNPAPALHALEDEGASFVITRHGRPIGRLVPLEVGNDTERVVAGGAVPLSVEGTAALAGLLNAHPDPDWSAELTAEREADRKSA